MHQAGSRPTPGDRHLGRVEHQDGTLLGPTAVTAANRAIWQLTGAVKLYDGGADGVGSMTADNTLFAAGGLFAP